MAIVGPDKSWRLAHNGVVIIILEEISGHTDSKAEVDRRIGGIDVRFQW